MNIAVFLFPGAEELDFVGPWEVLAAWADGWPDDAVTVFTVSPEPGPIRAAKGLSVTTHWASLERLAELGSNIEVRPTDRFVDRGTIVTAAGVSAGIDMALHLVARLHSPERARQVRRYIQYDPEPPV